MPQRTVDVEVVKEAVLVACRAPSVHTVNRSDWLWCWPNPLAVGS